jgi:hypothetical protein
MALKFAAALSGAILLTLGAAEARDVDVAGDTSLAQALVDARSGDRLLLAPGAYAALDLRRRSFSPALTIAAADAAAPPVFRAGLFVDVVGVALDNLAFVGEQGDAPQSTSALDIRGGSDITLTGLRISTSSNGVLIRGASRVVVASSRLEGPFRGVVVFDANNIEIRRNTFRLIGVDGVAARGAVGLNIRDNYFADFRNIDAARYHPDAVQLWSRGAARANENVLISGNLIRRGAGDPSQGIFVRTPELTTRGLVIEENVVEQSMGQGIAVAGAAGVVIRNNTVIPHDARIDRPGVDVRAPISDASVTGNIMIASRIAPEIDAADNDAAGFHGKEIDRFVAARVVGAAPRKTPEDYLPSGALGARDFVKDIWRGDDRAPRAP